VWPEHGIEDLEDGLDAPKAQRQYFEYTLEGSRIAERY
jgi:hypothetical protein